MKTKISISLLLFTCLFVACNKEIDPIQTTNTPKEYTITLGITTEVTEEYLPLANVRSISANNIDKITTRNSTNDLYGIQVYKGTQSFAYGLFDDISNLKINLLSGNKYKFVVTLVKDGKTKLYSSNNKYFYAPFNFGSTTSPLNNYFSYDKNYSFRGLGDGYSRLKDDKNYYYPETDRYYGEIENYEPTNNESLSIELKHAAFGLKYSVTGITDGRIRFICKNNKQTFFDETGISTNYTSQEKVFTFEKVRDSWLYADNYTENVTVNVIWTRDVGVVQDLGSKVVQVKRNAMNIIRLKLGADDGSSTFGITIDEDTQMNNEEVTVPLS